MSNTIKNNKVIKLKNKLNDDFYYHALKEVRKRGINKSVTNKWPWNKRNFNRYEKGVITKLFKETISHRFENYIPIKKGRKESKTSYKKRVAKIKLTYNQQGHLTKGVYISIPKNIAEKSRFIGTKLYTPKIITDSGTTREVHIPVNKLFIAELFAHIENMQDHGYDCNDILAIDKSELLYDRLEDYIIDVWIENKKPDFMHILYGTGKSGLGYKFTKDDYFDSAASMANDILKVACEYGDKINISAMLFNGFIGIFIIEDNRKTKRKGKNNGKRRRAI